LRKDRENVDSLVAEYYKWATGQGGRDPETLLSRRLSPRARRNLVQAMNDTNIALAFAEYVRAAVSGATEASAMPMGARGRG